MMRCPAVEWTPFPRIDGIISIVVGPVRIVIIIPIISPVITGIVRIIPVSTIPGRPWRPPIIIIVPERITPPIRRTPVWVKSHISAP